MSFALIFTTPVTTDEGLVELRDAVDKGTIGPYTVRTLKIVQKADSTIASTPEEKTTQGISGELLVEFPCQLFHESNERIKVCYNILVGKKRIKAKRRAHVPNIILKYRMRL